MASKYALILLLLVLAGCAQVGRISGGPQDTFAPKPVEGKMSPANASTNFSGNQITIEFDEFFKLVNPNQTIQMVPPHTTLSTSVSRKTLTISWEDSLQPNTTYAIYLNGALKDYTEGNDSTMQFVFSTGSQIDSLSYSVAVMNAWTQEPENEAVAVLYGDNDELVSVAQVSNGVASMNYLRAGTYKMIVMNDENRDLEYQSNERVGFNETGTITVDSSYFDSIPIRMYTPHPKPKIRTVKPINPCELGVGLSFEPDPLATKITLDNQIVGSSNVEWVEKDSLIIPRWTREAVNGDFAINTETFSDTVPYFVRSKDIETPMTLSSVNPNGVVPSEGMLFRSNGRVLSVDTSKIELMSVSDSTQITDFNVEILGRQFSIQLPEEVSGSVSVKIPAGSIGLSCGENQELSGTFKLLGEKDLGTIEVSLPNYDEPVIVDLLKGTAIVKRLEKRASDTLLTFDEIIPGEYTFRVIRDTNENGQWDIGDYETLRQPETIDTYSKVVKLRPNWTIEVTLNPLE